MLYQDCYYLKHKQPTNLQSKKKLCVWDIIQNNDIHLISWLKFIKSSSTGEKLGPQGKKLYDFNNFF